MADSDSDEFVSASEGEEEEEVPVIKSTEEKKTIVEEMKEEKEEISEESVDTRDLSDGDRSEKEESETRGEDEADHTESHSVEAETEVEKVEDELVEEESGEIVDAAAEDPSVPDISALIISEEPGRKESTSTSSGEGKEKKEWDKVEELEEQSSLDEGKSGWDDWGDDSADIPPKEDTVEKTTSKAATKPVDEEEAAEGWDDWGNEEVEESPSKPAEKSKGSTKISSQPTDDFEARREQMLSKLGGSSKETKEASGWGWGGVLSGIGETFSSAVESSLGLPSAQELARKHAEIEKMGNENPIERPQEVSQSSTQPQSSFGGFGMFSGIVNGGIDVLESIGKKTFETITVREEEKGRRRFIFAAEKGENLSDVLKELRERNEAEAAISASAGHSSSSSAPRLPDMATSFERSDGMVHLEALELVATSRPKQKQSVHRKLMALLENERVDAIDNDDEFAAELRHAVKETGLPYSPDAIISIDHELDGRLRAGDGMSSEELFKEGVDSLVQFTAGSVHLVSKLASLLAVMGGSDFAPFVSIYRILSTRCTHIANLYMLAISASDSGSSADELGTQVLVEASTAIEFIRQAHALVIPIIEVK